MKFDLDSNPEGLPYTEPHCYRLTTERGVVLHAHLNLTTQMWQVNLNDSLTVEDASELALGLQTLSQALYGLKAQALRYDAPTPEVYWAEREVEGRSDGDPPYRVLP